VRENGVPAGRVECDADRDEEPDEQQAEPDDEVSQRDRHRRLVIRVDLTGNCAHGRLYVLGDPAGVPEHLRRRAATDHTGNIFGTTGCSPWHQSLDVTEETSPIAETAAPKDRPRETLDVRDLPPPQPLQNTLERLAEVDAETVLVQRNDRAPRHLYPKLSDRGYEYETVEGDDVVTTVIWTPYPSE